MISIINIHRFIKAGISSYIPLSGTAYTLLHRKNKTNKMKQILLLLVASTCVHRSDSLKVSFDNGSEYEGRVDIYHNGTLGSVCDFGWDLNDIQFKCKELSFEPAQLMMIETKLVIMGAI